MARRSLPKSTRLANIASKRPKKARRILGKETLKLGSKAFNKMFPQLGKLMGGVYGKSSGSSSESNDLSIQMYNSSFSEILENQNKQNDILNKILQQLKNSNNFSGNNNDGNDSPFIANYKPRRTPAPEATPKPVDTPERPVTPEATPKPVDTPERPVAVDVPERPVAVDVPERPITSEAATRIAQSPVLSSTPPPALPTPTVTPVPTAPIDTPKPIDVPAAPRPVDVPTRPVDVPTRPIDVPEAQTRTRMSVLSEPNIESKPRIQPTFDAVPSLSPAATPAPPAAPADVSRTPIPGPDASRVPPTGTTETPRSTSTGIGDTVNRINAGTGKAAGIGLGVGAGVAEITGQNATSGAIAGASAAATTVVLSQAAEETIKRMVRETAIGVAIKKVPFAGLLAGLYFSAERALAGDWVGSGLELTSGVAGTLGGVTFGAGTAASVAIDVGLLTRDIYKTLYHKFPEDETDASIRDANMAAIGTSITKAFNDFISNAPTPQRPEFNEETREKLMAIYQAAQGEGERAQALRNIIGEDVIAGLTPLLRQNTNRNGRQSNAAREGMARVLARIEPLVTQRSAPSARMLEIPPPAPPAPETPSTQNKDDSDGSGDGGEDGGSGSDATLIQEMPETPDATAIALTESPDKSPREETPEIPDATTLKEETPETPAKTPDAVASTPETPANKSATPEKFDTPLKEVTPEIPYKSITPEKLEAVIPKIQNKDKENNNLDVDNINKNSMMSLTLKEFERINFEARLIKFESTGLQSKLTDTDTIQNRSSAGGGFAGISNISGSAGNIAASAMGNITTGDGRATNGSAARALEFFQSKGWSLAQAAGIVANLDIETGGTFNPAAVGDGGKAYGIAQWHPDRQAHFQSWAGRSIRGSTFEQQLEFVQFELTEGREKRAGNRIRQTTTPQDAAAITDQFYERSDGTARERRIRRAITLAGNAAQDATQTNQASNTGVSGSESPQGAAQAPSTGGGNDAALSQASTGAQADTHNHGSSSGGQNSAAPVEPSPSTGADLAQAGTDMIAGDQRQALNPQGMINNNAPQSPVQQSESTQSNPREQMSSNEIPLRNRLESTFSYRS